MFKKVQVIVAALGAVALLGVAAGPAAAAPQHHGPDPVGAVLTPIAFGATHLVEPLAEGGVFVFYGTHYLVDHVIPDALGHGAFFLIGQGWVAHEIADTVFFQALEHGAPLLFVLGYLGYSAAGACPELNISLSDLAPLPFSVPVANVPIGLCILGPAPSLPGGFPIPLPFIP